MPKKYLQTLALDDRLNTVSVNEESMMEGGTPYDTSVGDFVVTKFNGVHCRHYVGLLDEVGGSDKELEACYRKKIPSSSLFKKLNLYFKRNDKGASQSAS